MIEERDANPTADTPGRFRGRRAPTALTAGGTESSEVVARLSGTESSNPLPSSTESVSAVNSSAVGGEARGFVRSAHARDERRDVPCATRRRLSLFL